MLMEPPHSKSQVFNQRVPNRRNPVVPPLRGMGRSSSFHDPYYEPAYNVSKTERGKSEFRGLGVPKTDYRRQR